MNQEKETNKPSRRKFFAYLFACFAGAFTAVGTLGYWITYRVLGEDEIVEYMRKRYDYLIIDKSEIHSFVKDLLAEIGNDGKGLRTKKLNRYDTVFLLSTDLPENNWDISKPVKYIGLYRPEDGCNNPLAEFLDYEEIEIEV